MEVCVFFWFVFFFWFLCFFGFCVFLFFFVFLCFFCFCVLFFALLLFCLGVLVLGFRSKRDPLGKTTGGWVYFSLYRVFPVLGN